MMILVYLPDTYTLQGYSEDRDEMRNCVKGLTSCPSFLLLSLLSSMLHSAAQGLRAQVGIGAMARSVATH